MKYSKERHMILWNFTEQYAHNPDGRLTTVEETRCLLDEIDRLNAERRELVSDIVLSQDTETPMTITDILNRLDGIPPAPESEGE